MRIVILGGGFGGMTAANILFDELPPGHDILIADRAPRFVMGLAKPWLMVGKTTREVAEYARAGLNHHGIPYVDWDVQQINLEKREIILSTQPVRYDYLIIALGVELAPQSIPGFLEGATNVYTVEGAERFQAQLKEVQNGPVMILVSRLPIKCPPAPYEMAMLVKEFLEKDGKNHIAVEVYTPEPFPLPVAGQACGDIVKDLVTQRGIKIFNQHPIKEIDPATRTLIFESGEKRNYEILAGIPPHVAPRVVREAGLVGESGWIPVDPQTLKTKHDRVYAIGDVTGIKLANGLALPKAGVFAEKEGEVVARNIAAEIRGEKATHAFDGRGECYMEVASDKAAKVWGDFLATPAPRVTIADPTTEASQEKSKFHEERISRWHLIKLPA